MSGRAACWLVLGLIVTVLVVLPACAFLKSIGRTATVAGGGAGGALLGSAAGPIGMAAGAGAGAGAVYAVQENSELRDGSLQGDGARDAETDRLKSLLLIAQGDLGLERRARAAAESGLESLKERTSSLKSSALVFLAACIVIRNLFHWPKLGRALLARRWLRAAYWLLHILIWPVRPEEPTQ